jgi:hypothetical protein
MMAGGEELRQARRRLRDGIGRRDANDVEALALGIGDQRGLELAKRLAAQKSRSA